MKKFEKDLLAIGRNDYLVTIITDDDYNVIKIIAEEDINETKKHTYKKGDEVKLSKADRNFITENLIEENTPFTDDDEEE